ncbi:MAG TPA: glycosyltransferase family 4 protein, partial [Stellaceae bacterium]|nr:glycosyltransferase family 4 protein [Stellaceae bacterium]
MQEQAHRPKLIFLVTEDWYFWSHRLPMARAAQAAGFEVAVATRVAEHGERIRAAGFTLHPLRWRRANLGPWSACRAIAEIARLYRRERPLLVHHIALKPSVFGGIAALLARVPAVINTVTGVGSIASARSLKARLLRAPVLLALTRLLERENSRIVVQNADDLALLSSFNPAARSRIVIIRGSGVDTGSLTPGPPPGSPPVIAGFAGRLLVDKGVPVLIEAQQRLQARGVDLHLWLAGAPDPENPSSIDAATLAAWRTLKGVRWLGHLADIRALWSKVHIAVLPSRREGLPKSLLEAASMGLPLIATDVPGCRDIAVAGV